MDELWQRYRQFWVPVLYGIGAFLAGLIVVHMVTSDPEAGRSQNDAKVANIKKFVAPTPAQRSGAKSTADELRKQAEAKARRLDQRHGEAEDPLAADPVEVFLRQAYRAAVLRGAVPADPARFDGDAAAAAQASARYEQLLKDRLELVRTQDPNVAFSRVRADVVQELVVRANRADVDVLPPAEDFGMSTVASVERAELPRRLANLALIAQVLDVAIREGVRSIDAVSILPPEVRVVSQGAEPFLSEWPVKVDLTALPSELSAVLDLLTDPARPTALGTCSIKQTAKKDGTVKAELKMYSLRVNPEVPLGLENEGGE
ncbi:MAG: hypothetical protein IT460_07590 [Planctomycetes bacterium]|nr:hypothetical protein [Planctomycetota bacterium]